MNPVTHLLASWVAADAAGLPKRDRLLVACAGVAPDLDGLGVVVEIATERMGSPLAWYSSYHHVLGHNIGFGLLLMLAVTVLAVRRLRAAIMAGLVFHLHLLGDLIGSRGPDGYQWPIPYLQPFSDGLQWTWSGQWQLNAWPNLAITALLVLTSLMLAYYRGYSPLEMISVRADSRLIDSLQGRFGKSEGIK